MLSSQQININTSSFLLMGNISLFLHDNPFILCYLHPEKDFFDLLFVSVLDACLLPIVLRGTEFFTATGDAELIVFCCKLCDDRCETTTPGAVGGRRLIGDGIGIEQEVATTAVWERRIEL